MVTVVRGGVSTPTTEGVGASRVGRVRSLSLSSPESGARVTVRVCGEGFSGGEKRVVWSEEQPLSLHDDFDLAK